MDAVVLGSIDGRAAVIGDTLKANGNVVIEVNRGVVVEVDGDRTAVTWMGGAHAVAVPDRSCCRWVGMVDVVEGGWGWMMSLRRERSMMVGDGGDMVMIKGMDGGNVVDAAPPVIDESR